MASTLRFFFHTSMSITQSINIQTTSINAITPTTGSLSIGDSQTDGVLNVGTGARTATGVINIGTGATRAGIINIGGHLNKQGDILGETGAYSTNSALYSVKVKSTQDILDNRLYGLYNEKILNNTFSTPGLKGFATDPINLNPLLNICFKLFSKYIIILFLIPLFIINNDISFINLSLFKYFK